MININITVNDDKTGAITLREDALGVMLGFAVDEDDTREAIVAAIGQAFTQLATAKADPPSTAPAPRPTTKPATSPTTKKPADKKPAAEPALDTANMFTF